MSATTIRTPRGELVIETAVIEVTSALPRLDHNWRYTDRAGHEHYWSDGYPTLVMVVEAAVGEPYWCDDCQEDHDSEPGDSHYECPLCHEPITPGLVGPSTFREFVPGRISYRLDGVEIDEAAARALYDEMHGGAR